MTQRQLTIKAINAAIAERFLNAYTLSKINRYVSIVEAKPTNSKFFYDWVRRAMGK